MANFLDFALMAEMMAKNFPDPSRRKPKLSSTPLKPGVKLNYGDLEGSARWRFALFFPPEQRGRMYRASTTDLVELAKYKKQVSGSLKTWFPFRRLDREVQVQIIEELGYGDLKCLERTSSEMKALVAVRTAILDEELFRDKVNLKALATAPRSRPQGPLEKVLDDGEVGDYDLHPLISCAEEVYEVSTRWETIGVKLLNCGQDDELPLLHTIKEIDENATTPPCAQFRMDLWTKQLGPAPPHGLYNKPGLVIVQGKRDAKGVVQPVTVEQFVKGTLAAVQSLHAYMPDPGRGLRWTFGEWRTEYMDDSACAHLAGPCWYRTDDW